MNNKCSPGVHFACKFTSYTPHRRTKKKEFFFASAIFYLNYYSFGDKTDGKIHIISPLKNMPQDKKMSMSNRTYIKLDGRIILKWI